MDYDELVEKLRNGNITEEAAKEYLGEDLVRQIESLKEYCQKNGYRVYAHGTSSMYAPNIMQRGLTLFHEDISFSEFKEKTNIENPDEFFEKGEVYRYNLKDITESEEYEVFVSNDIDINDTEKGYLSQHFTFGFPTYKELVGRFIAHNMGYPCDTMVLFAFPQDATLDEDIINQSYVYTKYPALNDVSFYKRELVNDLFCIGYLDVPQKQFVFNKNFGKHDAFGIHNFEEIEKTSRQR